jgi:hypothetical protein
MMFRYGLRMSETWRTKLDPVDTAATVAAIYRNLALRKYSAAGSLQAAARVIPGLTGELACMVGQPYQGRS